jgi:hypothetical protein
MGKVLKMGSIGKIRIVMWQGGRPKEKQTSLCSDNVTGGRIA